MDDRDEDDASLVLQRKLQELEKSRQKFLGHLNLDQRSSLAKASNTTEAILATVDSANFDWCRRSEGGTGAVATLKGNFHKTCRALDQHVPLFAMLPKEHEFVSVFYGAFNSIVAVSGDFRARDVHLSLPGLGVSNASINGHGASQDRR